MGHGHAGDFEGFRKVVHIALACLALFSKKHGRGRRDYVDERQMESLVLRRKINFRCSEDNQPTSTRSQSTKSKSSFAYSLRVSDLLVPRVRHLDGPKLRGFKSSSSSLIVWS